PVASYAHGILHGADQAAVGDPPPGKSSLPPSADGLTFAIGLRRRCKAGRRGESTIGATLTSSAAVRPRRAGTLVTPSSHLLCDSSKIDAWRPHMKALLYSAAFAILVSTPVFSADDSVSLVGTWTGQRDRIAKIEGRRGGLATLVITEQ